ncbi:MAG: hypothetical protein NVV63_12420 [Opitutus sp.]|nr:hypothetical protein [Opitutus sp.]
MARKAGQLTFGATKVRGLIETGNLIALITATDAAARWAQQDGRAPQGAALRSCRRRN